MNETMMKIILDEIALEFESEEAFCKYYLQCSYNDWVMWQKGQKSLPNEIMQKIKSLFSDYEWMLVQKVAEQSLFFPEKRNYAIFEFRRLKTLIAKKWIELPLCQVELVTNVSDHGTKDLVTLRISLKYGEWGYDDILNFPVPEKIFKQITYTPKGLIQWVDHELTDVYLKHTTNKEDINE